MKMPTFIDSINHAITGITYALRTQRNIRIHLAAAVLVLLASLYLSISRVELLILLLTIGVILVAEMLNTAMEVALNYMISSFHPIVRIIKDLCAGAVLFATIIAVVIGYIVFSPRLAEPIQIGILLVHRTPGHFAIILLFVAFVLTLAGKAITGRGEPLRGGLPSGHTTIAFAIWMFLSLLSRSPLIVIMVLVMALLIAQSRIRMGVHSILEVAAGALLGIGVVMLGFWIF